MSLAFPPSPTVGQTYQSWVWTGSAWAPMAVSLAPLGIRTITSTGQYVPTPGFVCGIVETVGGGGGASGAVAGTGEFMVGGGGGSGGYSRKFVTAGMVGASQNVTIGPGGAAGNPASAGGVTSFGALCIANGGSPGTAAAVGTVPNAGAGASVVGAVGDVVAAGMAGQPGFWGNNQTAYTRAGAGGSSFFGGGASPPGPALTQNGNPGSNYGGGGGGGAAYVNTQSSGGAGAPGVCIVTEFGSSAPVLWTPPAVLSGNRVLLARNTISTPVAAVVFTGLDATYDEYVVESTGILFSSTGDIFGMQVSQDGGASWIGSGTPYGIGFLQGYTGGGAGGGNYNYMWAAGGPFSATIPAYATLRLFRPASTVASNKYFRWEATGAVTSLGVTATVVAGGVPLTGSGVYNAIRLFGANQSFNFAQGTHSLYGIQK